MTLDRSWPAEVRAEAVRLGATDMSLEAVAAQVGVPVGTVRYWVHQERHRSDSQPAADTGELIDDDGDEDPVDFSDATSASVRLTRSAEKVLRRLERMVAAGRATDAKNLSISLGILLDKSTQLVAKALEAEAARSEISKRDGHMLAMVLRGVVRELDLPMEVRATVPGLVRKHIELVSSTTGRALATDLAAGVAGDPNERAARIREMRDELARRRAPVEPTGEDLAELDEQEPAVPLEAEPVVVDDVVAQVPELEPDLPPRPVERERHGPPRPPTVTQRYLYTPPGVDDPTRGGDAA